MKPSPSTGNLAPQNHGRAPRVDVLNNQEVTTGGGARFVVPDPEVMAVLTEEDPRIRHFPTDQVALAASRAATISEADYSRLVVRPLTQVVTAEFPGRELSLRAVGVSINGHIFPETEGDLDLADVTETVSQGTEKVGADEL